MCKLTGVMGAIFLLDKEKDYCCWSSNFYLICDYFSIAVANDQVLKDDIYFINEFKYGRNFDLVSLKSCRNKSLLILALYLEEVLKKNHWFWKHVAELREYQYLDWSVIPNLPENLSLSEKLYFDANSTFDNLRKLILAQVENAVAERSTLPPKKHLLLLIKHMILWKLRNQAELEKKRVKNLATELGVLHIINTI